MKSEGVQGLRREVVRVNVLNCYGTYLGGMKGHVHFLAVWFLPGASFFESSLVCLLTVANQSLQCVVFYFYHMHLLMQTQTANPSLTIAYTS